MGQKVNPIGFRLGVNRDWRSRLYASPQELPAFLHSDLEIRGYVKKKLQFAAVSKIVIERAWNSIRVTIFTARPGIVIGRKGAEIEKMTEEISKMAQGKQIKIDIQEIKSPELDAQLVAENVALQIERRIAYRRAMKKAVQTAMDFGAEGIRLRSSGRLNGAEISRYHSEREISAPLRRPEERRRIPSAPKSIAVCTAFFIARRYAIRRSICKATFSATSCASSSGDLISWMSILICLPWAIFEISSVIFSISAPFRPITIPGRAVKIVTRILFHARSMTIFETAANCSFFFT